MIQINKLSLMALALCASGALTACGTDTANGKAGGKGSASAALSDETQAAADQLLFIAEGQSDGHYGIACTALRTDLFATRQFLKAGTDWGNLIRTQPHQAFAANWKTYKSAGCVVGDARSECEQLRIKIGDAIAEVVKTPDWGVLQKNSRFVSLVDNYAKARAIDCIAPNGL